MRKARYMVELLESEGSFQYRSNGTDQWEKDKLDLFALLMQQSPQSDRMKIRSYIPQNRSGTYFYPCISLTGMFLCSLSAYTNARCMTNGISKLLFIQLLDPMGPEGLIC